MELLIILVLILLNGVFSRSELALVVDEHGQLKGMVTLTDLMAALAGAMPLARLREVLGIGQALPGKARGAYRTLAGFVLEQLGHVPAASDRFAWERYRFEVVDMDRHRIDQVLVSELEEAGGAAGIT